MSDLRMTRGDDVTFDIDVVDDDGAAVDLNPFAGMWFTAKRRISDPDSSAVFQKSLGVDLAVDDVTVNRASVTVAAADTDDLPDYTTRLLWDVQVKDDMGKLVTIASGTLTVSPDVTRADGSAS